MEFGRVDSLEGIDLRLPPDHPDTLAVLRGTRSPHPEVFIGLPTWGDDVAERIYPPGTPQARRLSAYARMFNAIELNATGYAYTPENFPKWTAQTPAHFRFCPKVPRAITHSPNLDWAGDAYVEFCAAARGLGERLGPAMLQLPESFGPGRFRELQAFLRAHGARAPLTVEVRHRDWFAIARQREAYFDLLSESGIGAAIVDVPGRRDLLHQRLTLPEAFIRFSGHDRGERDLPRVEAWAGRIKAWLDRGLKRLYLFTHHVPDTVSADWALDFIAALNRACGLDLNAPKLGGEAPEKQQLDLFSA